MIWVAKSFPEPCLCVTVGEQGAWSWVRSDFANNINYCDSRFQKTLRRWEDEGRESTSPILQYFQWEEKAMQRSVTLGGRRRVAALLSRLEQKVGQREDSPRLDRRNRRTWRQMVWGVLVGRSTRLLALARVVCEC